MIGVVFEFGKDIVEVRVDGNQVFMRNSEYGSHLVPFDGKCIRLDYDGVCKEHPDLIHAPDWKEQAVERLKKKLSKMKSEDEKIDYVIKDLRRFGYVPKYKQKRGFRPEKMQ